MKEITRGVILHAQNVGLNVVRIHNERFIIVVQRIQYEEYQRAIQILDTLDANGFPPDSEYYDKDNV